MNIREFFEKKKVELKQGYYAVEDPTDGILKFYKINKPEDGKWAGYPFLFVQASDDFYSVENKEHRNAILAEIRKDPMGAMQMYGREIGQCAICGKTLTDEISRQRGVGPICWSKIDE